MISNIRAIFWDVDGTMVMSEAIHESKMDYIADSFGHTLSHDTKALFHGTGDRRAYEIMKGLGYKGGVDDFIRECLNYYEQKLPVLEMREGFMEAFEFFAARGLPQAAVSNGIAPLVAMNIDRVGIGGRLEAIVDLDQMLAAGKLPKPAGDPYLEALARVNARRGGNIAPHECLVIEDSPAGVAAGKAAGMRVIYWKLFPNLTLKEADFEAYTGADLREICVNLPIYAG
jgi:beta-phosphoglucomutase-like phosphatase (HAD superfamily)